MIKGINTHPARGQQASPLTEIIPQSSRGDLTVVQLQQPHHQCFLLDICGTGQFRLSGMGCKGQFLQEAAHPPTPDT
ncbi:MAG: hypothetical protein D3922_11320, partial [Candidatus Electrothrix sp. AR1]|nr:hypothetical protein [Candidatus Electrothrix sp. AR1]